MPTLRVKQQRIDALKVYANNPYDHPKPQIDALKRSISDFGFLIPVLVTKENEVVAGHDRLIAAQELGHDTVPTVPITHLTKKQVRTYRIADNRIHELARVNKDIMGEELRALEALGVDLTATGYGVDQLDAFLEAEPDPDGDAPEAPKKPKTKEGTVWVLGAHRLICGDSESPAVVDRLLAGEEPHLMVTDPPYGVNYDANWRANSTLGNQEHRDIIHNDHRAEWTEAWQLFPGEVAYIWHAAWFAAEVALSLQAARFEIRSQIIWNKDRIAVYAVRKGGTAHWSGSRRQSTVWDVQRPAALDFKHPNQKPLECMRLPIVNNSKPGDGVYDPFAGTGTTLIAAEHTERRAFCIELDPAFCDVIVARWEKLTGEKASKETSRGRKA